MKHVVLAAVLVVAAAITSTGTAQPPSPPNSQRTALQSVTVANPLPDGIEVQAGSATIRPCNQLRRENGQINTAWHPPSQQAEDCRSRGPGNVMPETLWFWQVPRCGAESSGWLADWTVVARRRSIKHRNWSPTEKGHSGSRLINQPFGGVRRQSKGAGHSGCCGTDEDSMTG